MQIHKVVYNAGLQVALHIVHNQLLAKVHQLHKGQGQIANDLVMEFTLFDAVLYHIAHLSMFVYLAVNVCHFAYRVILHGLFWIPSYILFLAVNTLARRSCASCWIQLLASGDDILTLLILFNTSEGLLQMDSMKRTY